MNLFLKQLWTRRVIQFGTIYLGVAWALLQVASELEEALELPSWTDQTVLVLLVLIFPAVLILAWAQDNQASIEDSNPQRRRKSDKHSIPAIAVLPFVNMSEDTEKEHFADGMTEDIITGLTLSKHLSICSRTSTFGYKGKSPNIQQLATDLGVDYVVEGSIRPLGDRIRITVQLIRASSGDHVWSSKYDQPADEIFKIQDDVINSITRLLGVQIAKEESNRAAQKPSNLTSWELVHRDPHYLGGMHMKKGHQKNIKALKEALKKDPDYAYLHSCLAHAYASMILMGWSDDIMADYEAIEPHLRKAMTLAPDDPFNLFYCASALSYIARVDEAIDLCEHALAINPHYVDIYCPYGIALMLKGRFPEAENAFSNLDGCGPSDTEAWPYWLPLYRGILWFLLGRYHDAITLLRRTLVRLLGFEAPAIFMALCYYELGEEKAAQQAIQQAYAINPSLKLDTYEMMMETLHPDPGQGKHYSQLLRELWPAVQGASEVA